MNPAPETAWTTTDGAAGLRRQWTTCPPATLNLSSSLKTHNIFSHEDFIDKIAAIVYNSPHAISNL